MQVWKGGRKEEGTSKVISVLPSGLIYTVACRVANSVSETWTTDGGEAGRGGRGGWRLRTKASFQTFSLQPVFKLKGFN